MSLSKASGIRRAIAFFVVLLIAAIGVFLLVRYGDRALSIVRGHVQNRNGAKPPADERTIPWKTVRTHLHTLQIAHIPLSPRALPAIWALAEIGSNILFTTRLGRFGYLDESNHLHPLDLQTPMGLDALRQSALLKDPVFDLGQVRTHDLLSVQTGADSFDLYASHHRYTGECFQMVVSRIRLATSPEGIRVVSPDWEEIYVVRPCIEVKDIGMRFAGLEGGGRLVLLDENTLLLSVGDHEFDGLNGPYMAAMDPATDLGKIIEISIPNHSGRIYAMGMRNPQGLLIASDGRIWQTEHGPKGGDEVNLIRRGGNYGWPIVTYGLQYGSPPTPWPHNPHQGQHLGYDRPQFAFVPSVAISSIIEPSEVEFPLWVEHLLAGSLAARSLFALKTEGDAVVYAEAIKIGERLRDMISLRDGRIAMLTDSAQLILLRNAERHAGEPESFTVTGFSTLPPPDPIDVDFEGTPAETWGARIFQRDCRPCHTVTGVTLAGPPLNGLLDRGIGAFPGYPYSPALTGVSGKWTGDLLRGFIEHSDPRFAKTTMPRVGFDEDLHFEELMAYLATTKPSSPAPTRVQPSR